MARLGTTFAPTQHSTEQNDFTNLPNGIYQLEMVSSDTVIDGNNLSLKVTHAVVAPEEYKGRYVFDWFDINHDNAESQRRGGENLSKLCRAIGYDEENEGLLEDSEALHFRVFTARVKDNPAGVSKSGKPYKAKNSINRYYYPDEGDVPAPSIDANQPAPAKPANDNKPAARPAATQATAARAARRPWGSK